MVFILTLGPDSSSFPHTLQPALREYIGRPAEVYTELFLQQSWYKLAAAISASLQRDH